MPGSATMGTSLVDRMVALTDRIRGSIPIALGARQFRVYTVVRTWTGNSTGGGVPEDVATELTPRPIVEGYDGIRGRWIPGGIDEQGGCRLVELSLTYTEAEIIGPVLEDGQEWLIRVDDGMGQGVASRYYAVDGPPSPDRNKSLGWIVKLRRASDAVLP